MELPILNEIVIIFALSIVVILFCHRIKIPPIVGFLLTGVLAGPHGLGFVSAVDDVEVLATIGIILLLFSVGMEFSLKKILEFKRFFLIGGSIQVGLTVFLTFLVGQLLHRPFGESIFLGCIISLSSTAIVLKVLSETAQSDTPHGRVILGVLIFQDIAAIPMMLLTPFLANGGVQMDSALVMTAFMGITLLTVVLFAANKIIPQLLYQIAKTRSRELFLLSVLTICFSVAWLTSTIGLSLSLGAFLAGLIVSESEYRHEAIGDILPFQDVFTSFFFVSIGMLLNINFFLAQPFTILLITAGILLLKTATGAVAALLLKMPVRNALLAGITLSQIGEFSFVLAKNGFNYGLADDYRYQIFLAISLLTMGVTPTLIHFSPKIADIFLKLPMPSSLKTGLASGDSAPQKSSLKNHVIIVGFGLSGRNLMRAVKEALIPYVILEINPETVKKEKEKGEPIHYGDATHQSVLEHVNISEARVVAVVINDFFAACRTVELIRRLNPTVHIIAKTHYLKQMNIVCHFGANEVVSDEFGSSIEVLTKVMDFFEISTEQIEKTVAEARSFSYASLKT